MTLETDTRTATQLLLQDFPLSLHLPAFLSFLVMTDHLGQSKVKLKKLHLYKINRISSSLGAVVTFQHFFYVSSLT